MLRLFSWLVLISLLTLSSADSLALPFQDQENNSQEQIEEAKKKADDTADTSEQTLSKASNKRAKIFAPVDAISQKEQDLNHYLTKDNILPMLAGADDFITLIHENTASNQKGVMILLPDWQMSATSSNALNYLRETLPNQGWTTITIQPPSKPDGYPSNALKLIKKNEENKKNLDLYQDKLVLIMNAVMDKAKNYPGIFVVVSEGSNATLLGDLYSTGKLAAPSAMVMLSSYMLTDAQAFAETLAQSDVPILDLYLSREQQLVESNTALRKAQANKEMKVYYRQKRLHNNQAGYYPEKSLLIAINGWLKSIGW
ncbi:MAG: DUF3530 family protein [Colwellia sp.]|nr:DUF3530 family protein [Colwellia sp.]